MRKVLGDQAWETIEKNREKHAARHQLSARGPSVEVLAYAYLAQLSQLMLANDAWGLVRARFKDKRQLEDIVKAIATGRDEGTAALPARVRRPTRPCVGR
ncbi:MAG: hypothetical protein ACLP1X_04155 [Polyangiaceae bacterium]